MTWSGSSSKYETGYRWVIGGAVYTKATVTVTYTGAGSHFATLKVTGKGGSDSTSRTVTTPCP